jgi:hypothetical protein
MPYVPGASDIIDIVLSDFVDDIEDQPVDVGHKVAYGFRHEFGVWVV